MNLTDVEKAVVELSLRHPGITKEFLRTLLEAAGWESKHIKEAEVILSARLTMAQKHTPSPVVIASTSATAPAKKDDFTFYHPDGTEEGMLVIPEIVEVKKTEGEEKGVFANEDVSVFFDATKTQDGVLTETPNEKMIEREKNNPSSLMGEGSLITKSEVTRRSSVVADIPDNLPLVPFESSPHVWSFGRYKDTFHRDQVEELATVPTVKKEVVPIITPSVSESSNVQASQTEASDISEPPAKVTQAITEDVEIDFEKTPITKGDESLVVLAGIMLLAIMLILGYMYSNGRL